MHHESTVHADESHGESFGEELNLNLDRVAHNLKMDQMKKKKN